MAFVSISRMLFGSMLVKRLTSAKVCGSPEMIPKRAESISLSRMFKVFKTPGIRTNSPTILAR
jgi:hypothetical protein